MARPLRLESEDGVYHVLNRGNYRADLFRGAEKGQTLQFVLGGRGRDGGAVAPPFTAPDDGKKLNTPSVVVRGTAEAGSLVTVDHADNTVGTVVAQGAGTLFYQWQRQAAGTSGDSSRARVSVAPRPTPSP